MQLIICAHRWCEPQRFVRRLTNGTDVDGWWKHCKWCDVTWHDTDPGAPKVIIGEIIEVEASVREQATIKGGMTTL